MAWVAARVGVEDFLWSIPFAVEHATQVSWQASELIRLHEVVGSFSRMFLVIETVGMRSLEAV